MTQPNNQSNELFTYDLFLAYSAEDATWVRKKLLTKLKKANVSFIDESRFTPSLSLLQERERAIQQSRYTLLVLSPMWLASSWQSFDELFISNFGLATDTWRVLPLLIAPCELPPRLQKLVKVDLTANAAQGWRQLLHAVKSAPGQSVKNIGADYKPDALNTDLSKVPIRELYSRFRTWYTNQAKVPRRTTTIIDLVSRLRTWCTNYFKRITITMVVAFLMYIVNLMGGFVDVQSFFQSWSVTPPSPIVTIPLSTLTPQPTPTLFPPGVEGETLVVVADFLDQFDNDPDRFTQNLVDEIRKTLAGYKNVRIERLKRAIPSEHGSDIAMQIGKGSDINATIVIWGDYVGTDREPQVHIHFDIIKPISNYLSDSLFERYGPIQIAQQPSIFDFTISIGTHLGQVTAFIAGVTFYHASEYLAAEPLFTTAIPAADQPLATDFARAIRFYRGTNYLALGRFLEAKPDLDKLKPAKGGTSNSLDVLELSILNSLSLVSTALGNKQQALAYLNQALPLVRTVDDKVGEAAILNNIGFVYFGLGNKSQALAYLNQALPLFRAVGDKADEAATLNNIGRIYSALNDKQQALGYFNQALPIVQAINYKLGEAAILNNIGRIYSDLNEPRQALPLYNQALTIVREIGDKANEAGSLNNIGSTYHDLGDKPQALIYYNQALTIAREIGDKTQEAGSLNNIGSLYSDRGDTQQSLGYYNQALALFQAVSDKAGEATTLTNIGKVYDELGDEQQALLYYNQGLLILRQIGNKAEEATTLNNIGAIYYSQGKTMDALRSMNDALTIRRESGLAWDMVQSYWWIGLIHQKLGDLDAAAQSIKIAITLATNLNHFALPDLQALLTEIDVQREK